MVIPETFEDILDDLLIRISEKLQISETQHKQAEERYIAAGKWLAQEGTLLANYSPSIYPQGSLRIGTTVKPLSYQEYDLDLVCELEINYHINEPREILNAVERRLREHKSYAPMIQRKNRCIRLDYANEFHMDILPACPNGNENNGKLKVPDRELEEWKDSNPKGFAIWFEERTTTFRLFAERMVVAGVDPLPDLESLERKPPLKKAVQLIKRHRDICFKNYEDLSPISIVLTTLAGLHYEGHLSVNASLLHILKDIVNQIPKDGRLVVLNPSNLAEDLSEKWDKDFKAYLSFCEWIRGFYSLWEKINNTSGIHNVAEILKQMFGEKVTDEAIKEQTEVINTARKKNILGISAGTGIITSHSARNTVPIKMNTFYGA